MRNKKNELKNLRNNKIIFICIIIFIAFFILICRTIYISGKYKDEATVAVANNELNRNSTQGVINPVRGNIYDTNMKSMATSYSEYNIILDVRELNNVDKPEKKEYILTTIGEVLGIPDDVMLSYIATDDEGNLLYDTHYLIIARNQPIEVVNELKETGVGYWYAEEVPKRYYPYDSSAAQVVGFMRPDNSYGLEEQYNSYMTGVAGRNFSSMNSKEDVVENTVPAEDGNYIVTTIDMNIQQFADEAVEQSIELYNPEHVGVVVMDPNTGEILAMSQYPTFNPNYPSDTDYIDYKETNSDIPKTEEEVQEEELNALYSSWQNFNISYTFEPGSIFKPIVVASALDAGVITPTDEFLCEGGIYVGDTWIPCWDKSGHGTQNVNQVLANSCNVGMILIAQEMGPELFYKTMKDFGMGEVTGIDLPYEASAENLIYSENQLNPVELATSSMGQGFNSTVIQQIVAFSAVINGGYIMKPYVVSEVVDTDGNIVEQNEPVVVRKVISTETSDYMKIALEEVVSPTGTGNKVQIPGYSIGGKSGTAQQGRPEEGEKQEYTISFTAYLPAEDPSIIATVVIDKPEEFIDGVTSAGVVMHDLLVKIIDYENIPPDKPYEYDETQFNSDETIVMEDFVGTSTLYAIDQLNKLGLDYEITSTGGDYVSSQVPVAGSVVPKNTKVFLKLETKDKTVELAEIPDVSGKSVDEAIIILTEAGFVPIIDETLILEQSENTNSENNVVVYDQMPSPYKNVPVGTEVKLKVTEEKKTYE